MYGTACCRKNSECSRVLCKWIVVLGVFVLTIGNELRTYSANDFWYLQAAVHLRGRVVFGMTMVKSIIIGNLEGHAVTCDCVTHHCTSSRDS